MDERALYEALRESVGRQVLVPDPTAGVERYAFRHALLQEAVYDDLLPGERTRLHSAFARTLEATASDGNRHAAELAYHWYAAHDLPRALEAAVRAGAAAEAGYAFPEAVAQYERAVELWDQVPDAEARAGFDRVDLLATLAGVSRFHEPARAVSHIEAAIRLVDEDADPIRAGLLNERLGRYAWIAGQGDCSQDAYRAAMALIPQEPPTEARARALAGLSQILMLAGWFEESSVLANESLALAGAVARRRDRGTCPQHTGRRQGHPRRPRRWLRGPERIVGDRGEVGRRRRHRSGIRELGLGPRGGGPARGGDRAGLGRGGFRERSRFDAVLRVAHPVQRRRRPVPPRPMGRERASAPARRRGEPARHQRDPRRRAARPACHGTRPVR